MSLDQSVYHVKPSGLGLRETIGSMAGWLWRWQDLITQLVEENRDGADEKTGQTRVGKRLGFGQRTVGRWKSGERKPSLENVERVCEKLGLSASYFEVQDPGSVPYVAFVASDVETIVYPALREFAKSPAWEILDDHHKITLKRLRLVGAAPTRKTFEAFAVALQKTTVPPGGAAAHPAERVKTKRRRV